MHIVTLINIENIYKYLHNNTNLSITLTTKAKSLYMHRVVVVFLSKLNILYLDEHFEIE